MTPVRRQGLLKEKCIFLYLSFLVLMPRLLWNALSIRNFQATLFKYKRTRNKSEKSVLRNYYIQLFPYKQNKKTQRTLMLVASWGVWNVGLWPPPGLATAFCIAEVRGVCFLFLLHQPSYKVGPKTIVMNRVINGPVFNGL